MPTVMSKEDWLKGVMGLGIVKDALIPTLKTHYLQKAKEWNTDDDHLKHLLDLGAANEVKQVKREESTWYVNCSECRSILKMIEMTHSRPARLMWMNNQRDDSCPSEYRLAKIFMPGGNKMTKDYSDLDALVILEILKNNTRFGHMKNEILNLIVIRNRLMHSNDNCISADELKAAFTTMKKLLQDDIFKNLEECTTAVKELDKLKKENIIYEIDESNETWKLAIDIQKKARGGEGIAKPSPEAMNILLKNIQAELEKEKNELQKEKMEQKKLRSELSKSEEQRKAEQKQWKYKQERVETDLKNVQSKLKDSEKKYNIDVENLEAENKKLVDELLKHDPSIAGRIAKGAVTGTGVGILGGPIGAIVGGAAGGVVGGVSFFWDKITK
ncbi:uncharacterized protein LOC132726128 [Ruditapes philippinarum]|uniref:uncharacterized protein LOC132726128 n=1 Tax=Ruditapes philippinarum TaxID=129788 RepID=UPI00295AA789|nr:uncharacterized protein LOC132726128 [Ruditapes philippinarum]XP_060567382.1 uncharacterized protein LOC132726128 [Ruditapes philippinarum]